MQQHAKVHGGLHYPFHGATRKTQGDTGDRECPAQFVPSCWLVSEFFRTAANHLFNQLISTSGFQRLDGLKQLGTVYAAIPAAVHTRFEHSMGVAALAMRLACRLWENLKELHPEEAEKIAWDDIVAVGIAALCHDLGHGPWSHGWEAFCKMLKIEWTHEEMSCTMVDHITQGLETLSEAQIDLAKLLIQGRVQEAAEGKEWLFDIVANVRDGLDVDKLDYLFRDCLMTARDHWTHEDFEELIKHAKVIRGRVCYSVNAFDLVVKVFQARRKMHEEVYTHPVAQIANYMIMEALVLADPVLKFSQRMKDPATFTELTDQSVVDEVLNHDITTVLDAQAQENLQQAQGILQAVKHHEWYPLLGDKVEVLEGIEAPSAQSLCDLAGLRTGQEVQQDQIVVRKYTIHWGMGKEAPWDKITWFDPATGAVVPTPNGGPEGPYQRTYVRVFSKTYDAKTVAALEQALKASQARQQNKVACLGKVNLVIASTPAPQRPDLHDMHTTPGGSQESRVSGAAPQGHHGNEALDKASGSEPETSHESPRQSQCSHRPQEHEQGQGEGTGEESECEPSPKRLCRRRLSEHPEFIHSDSDSDPEFEYMGGTQQ